MATLTSLGASRTVSASKYLLEAVAQDALKARIEKSLGWPVHIPQHGEVEVPV